MRIKAEQAEEDRQVQMESQMAEPCYQGCVKEGDGGDCSRQRSAPAADDHEENPSSSERDGGRDEVVYRFRLTQQPKDDADENGIERRPVEIHVRTRRQWQIVLHGDSTQGQ